jgi:predicted phosphoribosyltransferase
MVGIYGDRKDAGNALASHLEAYRGRPSIVLAIPNGGIPIGLRVRERLGSEFGVLVVRKLHIPWDPEAGFGAMAPDGTVVFNEPLRRALGLTGEEERAVIESELTAIARRIEMYGAGTLPRLKGKVVILVDDGLASGYSMMAAVRYVRQRGPKEIVVAVPTASQSAMSLVTRVADAVVCPNVRSGPVFAVADAYRDWRDLGHEEILALLRAEGEEDETAAPATTTERVS